jgi:hypothetical protein
MVLRIWHMAVLLLATMLLGWAVLPTQAAAALVVLVGAMVAAFLFARMRGIQRDLETEIQTLLRDRDRTRALADAERGIYGDAISWDAHHVRPAASEAVVAGEESPFVRYSQSL